VPLNTTEGGWNRGDPTQSIHDRVLSFLRENDDWAFHARELADEVLDTDWELAHRRERERERLGEDEFRERVAAGEYDGQLVEDSGGKAVADSIQTQATIDICNALVRAGEVQVRAVPPEATNIPHPDEEVLYYTYDGQDADGGATGGEDAEATDDADPAGGEDDADDDPATTDDTTGENAAGD
jgi:hypothetical protein